MNKEIDNNMEMLIRSLLLGLLGNRKTSIAMDPNARREIDKKIQSIVRLFLTVILFHGVGNKVYKMTDAKKKIPENKAKRNVFMKYILC